MFFYMAILFFRMKKYSVLFFLLISTTCLSFSENQNSSPCRPEITDIQFISVALGEDPPGTDALDQLERDIKGLLPDIVGSMLDDFIGTSGVSMFQVAALAAKSTKYFAEIYAIYSYRYVHNNKPTTEWKMEREKLENGAIDYFPGGTQGANAARIAKASKIRDIEAYHQRKVQEECKKLHKK